MLEVLISAWNSEIILRLKSQLVSRLNNKPVKRLRFNVNKKDTPIV